MRDKFISLQRKGNFDTAGEFIEYLLFKSNGVDRLHEIFKIQDEFFTRFHSEPEHSIISEHDRQKYSKDYILALVEEVIEVLMCIPRRKLHSPNSNSIDKIKLREELVDCFKYVLTLLLINNINDEEFYQEFLRKSKIVEKKYDKFFKGVKVHEK